MKAAESVWAQAAGWVPHWWQGSTGPAGTALQWLLFPAELGYRAVTKARNIAYDSTLLASAAPPVPVVSVGNLSVGGSGKTPFAAWVAARLHERECRPAIVQRGYGRDEVMVHRELNPDVPVFTDPVRIRAVEAAARCGRGVVILDDGFQHRQLERDLDLLLVSADAWRGSRRLLPCGPWREAADAANRADLVIAIHKSADSAAVRMVERDFQGRAREAAVVTCLIEPSKLAPLHGIDALPVRHLEGQRVLAVAALAMPNLFAENLESAGAAVELAAFPDHHDFSEREAVALMGRAAGRPIVVTLKDAVKLRNHWGPDRPVFVLHQSVRIAAGQALLETVLSRIASMVRP